MKHEEKVRLWDAVNRVVKASGGRPDNMSVARQRSVIVLEGTVEEMIKAKLLEEQRKNKHLIDAILVLGADTARIRE